jgi:endonuclease YncB( thermonuclease family)
MQGLKAKDRVEHMFKSFVFLFFIFFSVIQLGQAGEPKHFWTDASKVNVIDGDTMEVDGNIIKLRGIDAPEVGQECSHKGHLWSCGMTAALDLKKVFYMSRMAALHCWIFAENSLWQTATCYLNDKDIAASLLTSGLVMPLSSASPHYISLKEQAVEGGLGIWGGDFILPDKWVHGERLKEEKSECVFKAYTNSKGQKTFLTPFDEGYEEVKKLTTIYCSDETALNDGYKHILP